MTTSHLDFANATIAERLTAPMSPVLRDALDGLLDTPKQLPSRLFYDTQGAQLFEKITRLDEYYLTRTERSILTTYASDIANVVGQNSIVIEYGSGSAEKIRLLLDTLEPRAYVPVDVSAQQLADTADALQLERPGLAVYPVEADFTTMTELPLQLPDARRVGLFLGSTIGNLHPADARAFLRRVGTHIGKDGMLLLGVDLKKDATVLHAAYNDRDGVTAAFNMNALHHVRKSCNAIVDTDAFGHYAFYNPLAGRIEMHLVATRATTITLRDHTIRFAAGEGIWTESSYKYTPAGVDQLARESGFSVIQCWTDPDRWFAVVALSPRTAAP
jgi:dimethylhistidine N-methyltransferase